jgi:Fe-S-cluster-containing hydrogenase component 2
MCGAIKMVDRVAVVDQLSCMSCHECVDLCDWNAIEWTPAARNKTPKRVKRGVQIHPEPQWQAIEIRPRTPTKTPTVNWARVANGVIFTSVATVIAVTAWMN